jgi:hypothetical protein
MDDPGVVGLHGVFEQQLPVAVHIDLDVPGLHHLAEAVRAEQLRQVAEIGGEVRGVVVIVQEDRAFPDLHADRDQAVRRLFELRHLAHAGRAGERAVEPVVPGVIGADDVVGVPAALQQDRGAVPAHIGEGTQHAVLAAHQQHRPADAVERLVVAGARHFLDAAGEEPGLEMDVLDLGLEHLRVSIEARRRALGVAERRLGPTHRVPEPAWWRSS